MSEVERGMAHYCMKLKQTFHVNVNEFEGSGKARRYRQCIIRGYAGKKEFQVSI